jgi:16S rRNA (guanine527-N7)-methyltransferase
VSEPRADLLRGAAVILGRPLGDREASDLWSYLDLLARWNSVHRLVGSSDRRWLIENIVLDSLLFLSAVPPEARSLLDLGSGAGVPGLPLKIVRPEISLTMVESRRRRASFLAEAIRSLDLVDASVVHGRAESLVAEGRRFDVVAARCAGPAEGVLALGSSLLTPGGVVVVSGPPKARSVGSASVVQVRNPITGAARHLLIRR